MIEAMLEPHLKRQANASQKDVGLTFLIIGGAYMLSCPACGFVRIFLIYLNSYYVNSIFVLSLIKMFELLIQFLD